MFSLAKMQPDYKTPGVITDRSGKVTPDNHAVISEPDSNWDATKKYGLAVRYYFGSKLSNDF